VDKDLTKVLVKKNSVKLDENQKPKSYYSIDVNFKAFNIKN
jgi:hypothetical protein